MVRPGRGAWSPDAKAAPGRGRERRRAAGAALEDAHSVLERDPDAPGERDADEGPEYRGLGIEPALPDAEGARRCRRFAARARGLQLGNLLRAHVPLGIDRLDQIIADQPDHQ